MVPEGIGLELPTKNVDAPGRPHIDICPPSLQDREFVAAEDRIELRPVPYSAPAALPSWVGRHTSRPIVYLTLGTAFGTRSCSPRPSRGWRDGTYASWSS